MKRSACERLSLGPLTGAWRRIVKRRHWRTRLSARHSRTIPGRFQAGTEQAPSYQILYLAEDYVSGLFEVGALLGDPERPMNNSRDRTAWLTLTFDVALLHVADLTDPKQQRRIGTNLQELTGLWDEFLPVGTAPTQRLGKALFDLPHLEAFLAPSAARPGARNLIVFPEKLGRGSRVEFFNEETGRVERLRP